MYLHGSIHFFSISFCFLFFVSTEPGIFHTVVDGQVLVSKFLKRNGVPLSVERSGLVNIGDIILSVGGVEIGDDASIITGVLQEARARGVAVLKWIFRSSKCN